MILAEAISIDGGTLALLLAIVLFFCAAVVAVFVLGCVWARRAGAGDPVALRRWTVVVVLEALLSIPFLVEALGRQVLSGSVLAAAALAVHVALFLHARSRVP